MIIGILIILTFIVNCLLLVYIRQEQEDIYQGLKVKHDRNLEELREVKYIVKELKRRL